jgi:hypothetical protein
MMSSDMQWSRPCNGIAGLEQLTLYGNYVRVWLSLVGSLNLITLRHSYDLLTGLRSLTVVSVGQFYYAM